jgi:hypothetical protein
MRKSDSNSLQGIVLPKRRRPSFRPQIEALEDRLAPAPLTYFSLPLAPAMLRPSSITVSGALTGLQPIGSHVAGAGVHEMQVTVGENSPKTVIDLGPVFAQMSGILHADGLQLSLLGNTNPGLVKTVLSEGELALTYAASKCGTASITVGATDADGVSVRENILVTVLPLPATNTGASTFTAMQQTR